MNERIKLLVEQATIRVNNPTMDSAGEIILDNWEEGVSLSRFAELIVRDCINWCDAYSSVDGTAQKIRDAIKKDFGIEDSSESSTQKIISIKVESHTCPYRVEIHQNYELCECDHEREYQCRMDI